MLSQKAENYYAGWSFDKKLNSSGEVVDGNGWATSDYIPCSNVVSGQRANASTEKIITACFYNEDKTFNKAVQSSGSSTGNMYGNSGYKHIRFVVKASDIDDCYLRYVYGDKEYLFRGKNIE